MYVYFIQGQSTRLVKIGITRGNVYKRLATIQNSSPDKLKLLKAAKGDIGYERQLHKQFASVHSHGEWFYPSRGLMTFIQSLDGVKTKKTRKNKSNKRENAYIALREQRKERVRIAQEMYDNGLTKAEITEKLEVSLYTVTRYLASTKRTEKERRIRIANEMYMNEAPIPEIAEKLGVNCDTVSRYLVGASQRRRQQRINTVHKLHKNGASKTEIAKTLGVSYSTVTEYLKTF